MSSAPVRSTEGPSRSLGLSSLSLTLISDKGIQREDDWGCPLQFLVVGFDGDDADARREQARSAHIAMGDELVASGNKWYGAELRNEDDDVIGSMCLVDFAGDAELQEWLGREPYMVAEVWHNVHIHPCTVRDPWQFNRSNEFFEARRLT